MSATSAAVRIIVALDYANEADAIAMAKQLSPQLCRLKVGKELFTVCGPRLLEQLHDLGFEVFLDLKFHDIPNTVAQAVKAAASLGVWMVNVHASGGAAMLAAAVDALQASSSQTLLTAVTVLTSFDENELQTIGVTANINEQVLRLATLAQHNGLDGVVCSAREASMLRQHLPRSFCLVTPGIRPASSQQDDQVRVVTPQQAIQFGSDYLVIGRPICRHENPLAKLQEIHTSIARLSG